VLREVKPTSPPSVEYSLTDLGEQLVPAINAIADVGHKLKLRAKAKARSKAPRGRAAAQAAE
jgi:DNA-binding HxlR family transcriptional regulator